MCKTDDLIWSNRRCYSIEEEHGMELSMRSHAVVLKWNSCFHLLISESMTMSSLSNWGKMLGLSHACNTGGGLWVLWQFWQVILKVWSCDYYLIFLQRADAGVATGRGHGVAIFWCYITAHMSSCLWGEGGLSPQLLLIHLWRSSAGSPPIQLGVFYGMNKWSHVR